MLRGGEIRKALEGQGLGPQSGATNLRGSEVQVWLQVQQSLRQYGYEDKGKDVFNETSNR